MTKDGKQEGFGRGKKRGLTKTLMSLGPEQREVLREEANRRAQERKVLRPDASEIAREAIDLWQYLRSDTYGASLEMLDAISGLAKRLEETTGGLPVCRQIDALAEQGKAALRARAEALKAEVESSPPTTHGWAGDDEGTPAAAVRARARARRKP